MDLICRSTISMSEKSKKTYSDYGSICLLIRCWQCTYRQLLWPISAISFFGFFRQRKRTPSRYIFASLFKYNLCSNKWRDMNAYGWLAPNHLTRANESTNWGSRCRRFQVMSLWVCKVDGVNFLTLTRSGWYKPYPSRRWPQLKYKIIVSCANSYSSNAWSTQENTGRCHMAHEAVVWLVVQTAGIQKYNCHGQLYKVLFFKLNLEITRMLQKQLEENVPRSNEGDPRNCKILTVFVFISLFVRW